MVLRSTKILTALVLPLLALSCQQTKPAAEEPIEAMSFNIRYGLADDGPNSWEFRQELVAEVIRRNRPDLIGLQEAFRFQADYLMGSFPEYQYVGKQRDNNPDGGEECGMLFNSERFRLVDEGHFMLSETPGVHASKSWDSSLPRIASWVKLAATEASDEDSFLWLNTHFDHRGEVAREESAKLIASKVLELAAGHPIVVTGDFNTGEHSPPYKSIVGPGLLKDTYREVHPDKSDDEGTFGAWTGVDSGDRIDWILTNSGFEVTSAEIVKWNLDGRYPSDHFPVTARLVRARSSQR